jgi:GNAT superfamily N-acetyltransferase
VTVVGAARVERFRADDLDAVRALVLAGLEEHWGALDPTLNPDLEDLAGAYVHGAVLVARLDGAIVGCGVLVPTGTGEAEVKRMSVASEHRRRGIATAVLDALVDIARGWGCRAVVLETTTSWSDAVAFYRRAGFTHTHDDVGAFGSDSHFRLDL